MSSVTIVYPRTYENNTAIFDVKTWGSSERIAEYLDKKVDRPKLKIITANSGEVIAEIGGQELREAIFSH